MTEKKEGPHKKRGRKSKLDSELVAGALADNGGNIAAVARRFGVSRSRVHELVMKRPMLQRILHDARESSLDHAESALMRAVLGGDAWAICFFLKTQGRTRGYIERQEIQQDTKLTLSVVAEELSDEQLAQIVARDISASGGGSPTKAAGTQGLIELRPIHDA